MMRNLNIIIDAIDVEVSKELALRFSSFSYADYNINFSAVKSLPQLEKSLPFSKSIPGYQIIIYYYFDEVGVNRTSMQDYAELQTIANQFNNFVKQQLNCDQKLRELFTLNSLDSLDSLLLFAQTANQADPQSSYQPTMFSSKLNSNYYNRKAKKEFIAGAVAGLFSIPLFFIEPITATLFAVAAILLIVSALHHRGNAKQGDEAILQAPTQASI
ncbi:hypothetical protein [Legionella jordanis]|nr:hypothetical protein [Legionella jordanis]RMX03790.1 hypothetical protein EAW55_05370 [Legionella jordanis]RMX22149.1 hypothetical protein EAS68_01055 [Legionella jordanis]